MSDFDEFKAYYALAGELIEELSKEQLAECARLLALHVADYQRRFGDICGHADEGRRPGVGKWRLSVAAGARRAASYQPVPEFAEMR